MPVLIKVSLSKKLTKDFNSTGYALDITSELPIGSAHDPDTMAQATDELFRLAEDLITAQIEKAEPQPRSPAYTESASRPANGEAMRGNGNGHASAGNVRRGGGQAYAGKTNGNGHGNGSAKPGVPGITDAQARALQGLSRKLDEAPDRLAQDEFGMNMQELSIRQASELIDILKRQCSAMETRGGQR